MAEYEQIWPFTKLELVYALLVKRISAIGISSIIGNYGVFQVTGDFPELAILQNDHCTPVSHIMKLKNHIFTVVPKDFFDVNWRLPVFPCGQSLIAFDGAALLINELYLRRKNLLPFEN